MGRRFPGGRNRPRSLSLIVDDDGHDDEDEVWNIVEPFSDNLTALIS